MKRHIEPLAHLGLPCLPSPSRSPFCHSVEEQQEREAEYLEEQKEAARKRRAAELEQHKREEEQREREQRQQVQAAAAHAEEQVEVAAAVQASAAAAEERQAAMRREMLAREEAALQLSDDALGLMKRCASFDPQRVVAQLVADCVKALLAASVVLSSQLVPRFAHACDRLLTCVLQAQAAGVHCIPH